MAEQCREQPPSYSEAVGSSYVPTGPVVVDAVGIATSTNSTTTEMYNVRQYTIDYLQQVRHSERRLNTTNNQIVGIQSASNSFKGFLNILYE